jgi:FAD/FMN-containing dehydrogenase
MSSASLGSWGRYPPFPQGFTTCHTRSELPDTFRRTAAHYGTTLPYGAGRSYGDSCLAASDHVLRMRTLDRFIGADWQTGVLTAEAGVTLEEILRCMMCMARTITGVARWASMSED